MRTDVKLGIVTSMVVVFAAGGYFLFRGDAQAPISVADKTAATAPKTAAKPIVGKQPVTIPSRQVTSTRDNAGRGNLPVNRDSKLTAKPAERPAAGTPKERMPATQPSAEPFAARSADTAPANPVSLVPNAAPGGPGDSATREPEAGLASRTLMAAGEPAKPAPTTPADASVLISSPPAPTPTIAAPNTQPLGSPTNSPTSSPVEPKPDLGKAAVETHRVQPGDTFATLSQTYYGNVKYSKFLAESNPGVSDPGRLALGSTVKIPPLPSDIDARMASAAPAKAPPSTVAGEKRTYKVKSGDSFYRIAKEQLGNAERWKELMELNKSLVHGDPTALQPGQTLILPN